MTFVCSNTLLTNPYFTKSHTNYVLRNYIQIGTINLKDVLWESIYNGFDKLKQDRPETLLETQLELSSRK